MLFAVLLSLLLSSGCYADSIELEKATSPDSKVYLTVEPAPDSSDAGNGILQIRSVDTKKVLGSFEWGQFGPVIDPKSATAMWKDDSTAFALTWYMARGWTGSKIYVNKDKKWMELTFPLFQGVIVGHDGWANEGKGRLVAVQWLPSNIIKADFVARPYWVGSGNPPAIGDVDEDDWAYFQIERESKGPALVFLRLEPKTPAEAKTRDEALQRRSMNDEGPGD